MSRAGEDFFPLKDPQSFDGLDTGGELVEPQGLQDPLDDKLVPQSFEDIELLLSLGWLISSLGREGCSPVLRAYPEFSVLLVYTKLSVLRVYPELSVFLAYPELSLLQ